MTLIIILISLALSRFLPAVVNNQGYDWFQRLTEWLEKHLAAYRIWDSPMGVIIVLAIPLLLVLCIESYLCDVFSPLSFFFSLFILLVTLNYDGFSDDMEDLDDVYQSQDREQIQSELNELNLQEGRISSVLDYIVQRAHTDVFAVLFWFILLGPFGALMFRLAEQLDLSRKEIHGKFSSNAQQLYNILTWPTTRLLVLSFAMMGNLNEVMSAWQQHGVNDKSNESLLSQGAMASIQFDDEDTVNELLKQHNWILALREIIDRSLMLWMVLLALITIGGWIS